jgi:hypothetical protein
MKNIIYRISLFLMVLSLTACLEEELLIDNVSEGGDVVVSGTSSYLNGETSEVTLSFDLQETSSASIDEVQITKQLMTTEGNSEVVSLSPITESGDLVISTNDLFADVPVNGNVLTEADLSPGDKWVFGISIMMEDGRELTPLGNPEWSINFSCPSDIGGIYNTTASGSFGDGSGGEAAPYAGLSAQVELTPTETDGVYSIDDMSFGLYPQGYDDTPPSGRVRDICNSLSDLGDADRYGDPFTISGTVNADGTINLEWSNTYGDAGPVVLTPAN